MLFNSLLRSILILPSQPHHLPSSFLPSGFPTKTLYAFLFNVNLIWNGRTSYKRFSVIQHFGILFSMGCVCPYLIICSCCCVCVTNARSLSVKVTDKQNMHYIKLLLNLQKLWYVFPQWQGWSLKCQKSLYFQHLKIKTTILSWNVKHKSLNGDSKIECFFLVQHIDSRINQILDMIILGAGKTYFCDYIIGWSI